MRFASSGQGDLVTSGFAGAWLRELNLVGLGMDHGQLSRLPGEGKGPGKGHVGRNDGSLCPVPTAHCPVLYLGAWVRTVQYSTGQQRVDGCCWKIRCQPANKSARLWQHPPSPKGSSLRVRAGHISQRALSRFLAISPLALHKLR
jgi:hypothetical protein